MIAVEGGVDAGTAAGEHWRMEVVRIIADAAYEEASDATSGSASLVLGRSGRVRVGERADLAIASADPFELPAESIHSVRTALTVVGGEVVHEP